MQCRPKLIVGIDPGFETAVALLSMKGDIIDVRCERFFTKAQIINYISSHGDPVIVASDVRPAPKLVRKAATIFNALLFYPEEDLSLIEKARLNAGSNLKDQHEKDAFAAAKNAHEHFEKRFEKIDERMALEGLEEFTDEVKKMILSGSVGNVDDAIKAVKKNLLVPEEVKDKIKAMEGDLEKKENRILLLEEKNRELREKLRNSERKIPKKTISPGIISEKEIKIRQLEGMLKEKKLGNYDLKESIKSLKAGLKHAYSGDMVIPLVKSFDIPEIKNVHNEYDLKDKWLVVLDSAGVSEKAARYLDSISIFGIICEPSKKLGQLISNKIQIIDINKLDLKIFGDFAALNREELEKEAGKYDKKNFLKWLESYKRRGHEEAQ